MSKAFKVIQAMSGNDAIVIQRPYMEFCRNYNQAAVLSQLVFWSSTKPNGGWFYKKHAELASEVCLTVDQVRGALDKLKAKLKGALEVKFKKANGVPTPHYKFNQEQLISLIFPCEALPDMEVVNSPCRGGENTMSTWGNDHVLGGGENPSSITDLNHIELTDLKTTKSDSSKSKNKIITDEELKTLWNESIAESENPEQAQTVRVVPAKSSKDILKTYEIYKKLKASESQEPALIQDWLENYFSAALDFRASMAKPDGSFNWKISLEYACRPSSYEKILNWSVNA
ncbi:MAG: hypothetical protein ACK5NC_11300 [Vibrio sp.]